MRSLGRFFFFLYIPTLLFVILSCSKEDEEMFFRSGLSTDEYILTKVDESSNLLAFPSITANKNQTKIFIVYRDGSAHNSFDGVLVQKESDDNGKTWKNRKIIYRPRSGYDARDPQLLTLPDGSILCRFFERTTLENGQILSNVRCFVSKNDGQSYHYLSSMPNKTESKLAAARGNMLLLNNEIYSVNYNAWDNSWLVKSSDMGQTWEYVTNLDTAIKKTYQSNRINEASLGYADGKMYLVGRQAETGDKQLLWGISDDLGKSWSWTKLPQQGQAPSLTPLEGHFIMTYRDISKKSFDFDVVLMKAGTAVSNPLTILTSKSFDIGYGDVLPLEASFLVCFYSPEGLYCCEINYAALLEDKAFSDRSLKPIE